MINEPSLFRFDDISINTDKKKLIGMLHYLRLRLPWCRIIMAVSPAVMDLSACEEPCKRERVFPAHFHVESDFRIFYRMQCVGVPEFLVELKDAFGVELASHGMVHLDHRLMKKSAQELSIVMSCSLVRSNLFVPPFHKWDQRTEAVCKANAITILKTDSNWRHLAFHDYDPRWPNFYLHTHDFDLDAFKNKFPDGPY